MFSRTQNNRGLFVAAYIGESCQKIYIGCGDFVTGLPRDCNNPAIFVPNRTFTSSNLNFTCPAVIRYRDNTRRTLI